MHLNEHLDMLLGRYHWQHSARTAIGQSRLKFASLTELAAELAFLGLHDPAGSTLSTTEGSKCVSSGDATRSFGKWLPLRAGVGGC